MPTGHIHSHATDCYSFRCREEVYQILYFKSCICKLFALAEIEVKCKDAPPKIIVQPENVTVFLNDNEPFEDTPCTDYFSLLKRDKFIKIAVRAADRYRNNQIWAKRLNAIQVLENLNVIKLSTLLSSQDLSKILDSISELQQVVNNPRLSTADLINATSLPSKSLVYRSAAILTSVKVLNATRRTGLFLPATNKCPPSKQLLIPCEANTGKIDFYYNGALVSRDHPRFLYNKHGLQFLSAVCALGGNYTCVAVNGCARQSTSAFIDMPSKLRLFKPSQFVLKF